MDNVGAIIRSRRKEFGLTQAQFENDEGNPTVDILKRVLKTLGMQLTATVIEV